ncbi:MAG: hypothetical protein NTU79_24165 [Planctomycetota bacterium]|nr:hypothetical protein [Planctomycetota bacterium]
MIDELLSGMLDGVLSDDEVRQLEDAMSADPSVGLRLDELSRLRTGLLSGRSRSRLGAEFASKVLKLSQERAIGMGSECPAWLGSRQGESARTKSAKSKVADQPWKLPWVYGVVLASAVVFALVYASLPSRDAQSNLAESSLQENKAAPEELSSNIRSLLAANPPDSGSHETTVPEFSSTTPSTVDSMAQNEPSKTKVPSSNPTTSNLAINSHPDFSTNVVNFSKADLNQNKTKPEFDLPSERMYALVIDVSIDKVAIENRALESILKSHDVVYAEDLIINAEQLAALEDSQFIGRANAVESEKMGVMFIRAPIDKLSLAIEEIADRYKDFPEFSMDLAYDSSVKLLMKQLSGIRVAEGKNGVVLNLAPPQSSRSSLPFTVSAVRNKGMFSREMMKKGPSQVLPETQQMSYVLLMFRAAK